MTNEELVKRIQAGEQELINDLWIQVEKFIRHMAYKLYIRLPEQSIVEVDDLAQAGYLAFRSAIEGIINDIPKKMTN